MKCTHCGQTQRGSAGVTVEGTHYPLCHPDDGVDCYHLATVYRHPLADCPCKDGELPPEMMRTRANGYLGAYMTVDEALEAVWTALWPSEEELR